MSLNVRRTVAGILGAGAFTGATLFAAIPTAIALSAAPGMTIGFGGVIGSNVAFNEVSA